MKLFLPAERQIDPAPTRGLTSADARQRQQRFGRNDLLDTPTHGWQQVLRNSLRDPMLWFLAVSALLFAAMGDRLEATLLGLAVIPILLMDSWLHYRTQASTAGLGSILASQAVAVRDGQTASLPVEELVPGDLVQVGENEPFPADCLLVAGSVLQTDESALTGEALPVSKLPWSGSTDGQVDQAIESRYWGLAGTRLLTGQATARVVYTGAETLYGQIVRSARQGPRNQTPLQQAITRLVRQLIQAALAICILLAVTRLLQGHGWLDALISAVTLAIAALPEEFPVAFAFFLGLGVYRLAKRRALVRRAVVVENIGRVSCICTDKTGTLTEGSLKLQRIIPALDFDEGAVTDCAAAAARPGSGDPLDQALLATQTATPGELVTSFPFTEDRRREVNIRLLVDGNMQAFAKGAPEVLFDLCALDADQRKHWQQQVDTLAASGFKVIACARHILPANAQPQREPEQDFDFVGLLGFVDPLREGVRDAVLQARNAGIRIIMVTGDHPATAASIAVQAGITTQAPIIMSGEELARQPGSGGSASLDTVDVFARILPAQKQDIVQALQQAGEIVAVTGDGVNDVPAIRHADIGIAMGGRGTRSAREVADIVLLDDNFSTLIAAIAEGRQLFENLRLSFAYLMMVHFPLLLTATLIPFAGFPLLYLPVHIVWLELVIHPTALLVFQQPVPTGALQMLPSQGRATFFDRRQWLIIAVASALITALILANYVFALGDPAQTEHARSLALVTLLLANLMISASLSRWRNTTARLISLLTAASALLFVQIPVIAAALKLTPLHGIDWALAIAGVLLACAPVFLFRHSTTRSTPTEAV